jgi:hypothetical protein
MRVLYFFIGICVGLPALAAPVAQPEVVPVETPVYAVRVLPPRRI